MEEGFVKQGSLSSIPSSACRLSPLAQPFTMTRQASQSQALNLFPSLNPTKAFAPSASNHISPIDDSLLPNSSSNLINLEDDQLLLSSDGHNQSEFGAGKSHLQYQLGPFQRFCGPSWINEIGRDGFEFTNKLSLSTDTQGLSSVGSGRAQSINFESFHKPDAKVTPSKVSVASDMSNISPTFGSSITSSTFSSLNNIQPSSGNLSGSLFANHTDNTYGGNVLLKANSSGVNQENRLVRGSKEIHIVSSVSGMVEKSEHGVTSEDVLPSLASICSSLKMVNEDDDLDSPCWKGIQDSGKAFGRVSEPLHSQQNQLEAGPRLNPKAPQFFPSHAKGVTDYSQNNFVGDASTSSRKIEQPKFNPSPKGQRLVDSNVAITKPPGFSHATGYQHSSGVHEPGENAFILRNTNTSSIVSSPQMTKPYLADRNFTDHTMQGFTGRTEDRLHNIPNFSCPGVGSLDGFSEMLQYLPSAGSDINVSMKIKAIHYLSESLVQNNANDFDSLNDHDHNMICDSIVNLYALDKRRVKGKTPILGSPHTGSSDYHTKLTAIHKPSKIDFELTRSKDLVVHREPVNRSDSRCGPGYSHLSSKKIQDLNVGPEMGNISVLSTGVKENGQIDQHFHPQALLRLWIEAQAALCNMKYENHILRLKLQTVECRNEQV